MKKIVCFLLAVLFLLLSACAAPQSVPQMQRPLSTPTQTPAATLTPIHTPESSITPTPADTPELDEEEDDFICYDLEESIATADACRVVAGDTEYYLDTSQYMSFYMNPEFPLYSRDINDNDCNYLGTTGYSFQLCDSYIYIQSDIYMEDYPEGDITRLVNLETGTVTPLGIDMEIFIPDEGDTVYYTVDVESFIFKADPSMKHIKKFTVRIPEQDDIEAEFGTRYGTFDELCKDITITSIKDGWIYFYYDVFVYEGPGLFGGSYRIRTDGTGLEKTDEGQYYEE